MILNDHKIAFWVHIETGLATVTNYGLQCLLSKKLIPSIPCDESIMNGLPVFPSCLNIYPQLSVIVFTEDSERALSLMEKYGEKAFILYVKEESFIKEEKRFLIPSDIEQFAKDCFNDDANELIRHWFYVGQNTHVLSSENKVTILLPNGSGKSKAFNWRKE